MREGRRDGAVTSPFLAVVDGESHYLKAQDPKTFNYIITACTKSLGANDCFARLVTPAHPLKFAP